jgi:hypothetical protein
LTLFGGCEDWSLWRNEDQQGQDTKDDGLPQEPPADRVAGVLSVGALVAFALSRTVSRSGMLAPWFTEPARWVR